MLTDPVEDYARGFVPFLDCTIFLDSKPLIPRTETEYWAEIAIKKLQAISYKLTATQNPLRILDLFAGSGAIGVSVLKHVPNTRVDFGEIDTTHFPTIRKNIIENDIDEARTKIIETDVFRNVTGRYNFILANPPYIAKEKRARVQDSVLLHEPEQALFADNKGFALIEKTIRAAPSHLNPDGVLYVEHEPEHALKIAKVALETGLFAETLPDQYGVLRYSVLSFPRP